VVGRALFVAGWALGLGGVAAFSNEALSGAMLVAGGLAIVVSGFTPDLPAQIPTPSARAQILVRGGVMFVGAMWVLLGITQW
jgi:hypothetical protein